MVYSHNDVWEAHTKNIVSSKIHDDVHMMLPEKLLPTIWRIEYTLKNSFHMKLDSLLWPKIAERLSGCEATIEECGRLKKADFITELRQEIRMYPTWSTVYKFSMNEILHKVRGAYEESLNIFEEASNPDEESSNASGTDCKRCDRIFKEIDALLKSTPDTFTGLCLNCVKNWVKDVDRGCGRRGHHNYVSAWYGRLRWKQHDSTLEVEDWVPDRRYVTRRPGRSMFKDAGSTYGE
ncbi:hypothetical protein MMC14_006063 [Varicellaria rhodocarpa]|nr:hypothetical protein [Varicellaria rhodocarpa]